MGLGSIFLSCLLISCHLDDDDQNRASLHASLHPSVAVDSSDRPVVTWQYGTPFVDDEAVYLRRWNGSQWLELGGSATGRGLSNSTGRAMGPSLSIPFSGNPVVAWADSTSLFQIYLKMWDGAQWVELGGSAGGGGISNYPVGYGSAFSPSLSPDKSADPVVAWLMSSSTISAWSIHLKRWNGVQWVGLGESAVSGNTSISQAEGPSLAVDTLGNPVVAWLESVSGLNPTVQVYLKAWDGTQWIELGGSASGVGASGTTGLAFSMSLVPLSVDFIPFAIKSSLSFLNSCSFSRKCSNSSLSEASVNREFPNSNSYSALDLKRTFLPLSASDAEMTLSTWVSVKLSSISFICAIIPTIANALKAVTFQTLSFIKCK